MSPKLGPASSNIFVGYYEAELFSEISTPAVCFRYADDTFVTFQKSEEFLIRIYGLHFSLQFTFEKERNNSLPFLDVHERHTKVSYETKVHCEPTFTASAYAGNPLRR